MPTPLFEPTLKDALLALDDDEVVVVDCETRSEIESAGLYEGLRFPNSPSGRLQATRYLGSDRAAIRARRIQEGSRPRLVTPEEAAGKLRGEVSRIIVAMSDRELITKARISATLPGSPVLSLKNEIHPAVCARGNFGQRMQQLCDPLPPVGSIAILAVMRSGSYLLSELAAHLGLGQPEEHLKDPLIEAIRIRDRRDMSFRVWWESLEIAHRSANGWFATKIISHYLQRLRALLLDTEVEWLDDWIRSSRLITLVRRDLIRQAVSAYRAQRTGVYRARSEADLERSESMDLPYDFDGLLERYRFIQEQSDFVRVYADEVQPNRGQRLDLAYEGMSSDLTSSVNRLALFAGVETRSLPERPKNRKVASESALAMANRFRQDLELAIH